MAFESSINTASSAPALILGESLSLVVNLKNKLDGSPMLLEGSGAPTEITAKFRKNDNSAMVYTMTGGKIGVVPLNAGSIRIQVPAADTASFATGQNDVEVIVNQNGDISYHEYPGILNVEAPLF